MKTAMTILAFVALCLTCGCAHEAAKLDCEFGSSQIGGWEKMIAYPEGRYAQRQPEGLEGIHAEPAMNVYNRSFSKEPTKTNVIKFGIVSE